MQRRFLDSCLSCPRQPQQCASGDWEEAVPGEKSAPVTRPGPSPHQQAIITAMPGGLPGPKTPNIQQCPAHGMKCRRKWGGGVSLPCHFLVPSPWHLGGEVNYQEQKEAAQQLGSWNRSRSEGLGWGQRTITQKTEKQEGQRRGRVGLRRSCHWF